MTIFYTGKGDRGKSVMGGAKISKDDPLFDVLGSLDEVNSLVGWCRASISEKRKAYRRKRKASQHPRDAIHRAGGDRGDWHGTAHGGAGDKSQDARDRE